VSLKSVTLKNHCTTIIRASKRRPTVSDNITSLSEQCDMYNEKYHDERDLQSQVFHQQPMIDSAFMVFDMRSEACRQFNGNLLCSWLNEIHCHSDRDQISFSAILASSREHLLAPLNESRTKDIKPSRVYANINNMPMVQLISPDCHWYFHRFSRCIDDTINDHPNPRPRVAVIVAGTIQRFLFRSTVEKMIHPMVAKDGANVDYYLSLTTQKSAPYRSDRLYMSNTTTDPFLPVRDAATTADFIKTMLVKVGASARIVSIQTNIDIDGEEMLKIKREKAQEAHPDEDPDLRFPMFDIRTDEISRRTANGNRNLLKMHYAVQGLWEEAVQWEQESGERYDIVMFMRDDTHWLSDFSLKPFVDELEEGDVFIPSCDAREHPLTEFEINDHLVISKRPFAGIFGNYFSKLFEINPQDCKKRSGMGKRKQRGCNSEMLLNYVMDAEAVRVKKIPQSIVPFQRSVNVELNGSTTMCFHKFCQSNAKPVNLDHTDIGLCNNLYG